MSRENHQGATLPLSGGGATLFALVAMALTTAAGCGESADNEVRLIAAAPSDLPPAIVTGSPPDGVATSSGFVVPENVSYAEAEAAFSGKRYQEAVAMFEAYATRRPRNVWGHYMLGLSAWKTGDLATAAASLEAALSIDSVHVKSLLNLGRVLLEQGRAEDALARVETVLRLDPELADGHRVLGRVQSELGRNEEAIESFRRAIMLDERDAWSMNNMGLVLIRLGRYEDALGPLARATELGGDVPTFHNNLGVALERTGHVAAAAEAYRRVLSIYSTYGKASVSLARVERHAERTEEVPVDLGELSRLFAAEVQRWREVPKVETASEVTPAEPR